MLASVIAMTAIRGCQKDVPGIPEKISFRDTSKPSAAIDIALTSALSGSHQPELYRNSMSERVAASLNLNPVNANGKLKQTNRRIYYRL